MTAKIWPDLSMKFKTGCSNSKLVNPKSSNVNTQKFLFGNAFMHLKEVRLCLLSEGGVQRSSFWLPPINLQIAACLLTLG